MASDIQEALLDFVCNSFFVQRDDFDHSDSLIDQGVIDSFGLVEIAAFMEKKFGIKVTENDMIREYFGSIHKMERFIELKMSGEIK
ncbi:MAG: acyl carrier protein [Deltaproteobacteria bacterium]|nr:acyl carrier protein [Deltaproteobacteria bacterium]